VYQQASPDWQTLRLLISGSTREFPSLTESTAPVAGSSVTVFDVADFSSFSSEALSEVPSGVGPAAAA
jgi:hypothetical protein